MLTTSPPSTTPPANSSPTANARSPWAALGHSTVVVALAVGIAAGIREATALTAGSDGVRQHFTVISTLASGGFLYLIAALNLGALFGIRRVFKNMRA